MARRQSEKDVSKPAKAPARAEHPRPTRDMGRDMGRDIDQDTGRALESRLKAIEFERDTMKTALATAEARIKDLESRQTEIANRIAWTLDSLHSLLEEKS